MTNQKNVKCERYKDKQNCYRIAFINEVNSLYTIKKETINTTNQKIRLYILEIIISSS